ncbi:MAG: D-alanine--D-alanine ligase [Desulfobacterales bacterium]|jgi:D-alanine-D-alanine ligase|nr:D-alanine--D-alanine ligase [Desulfobacterales bacterium]
MRIGLTYDLRSEYLALGYSEDETAEFDRDETIHGIESALWRLGHETDRIGHIRRLVERLAAGHRWDLVFNIAEGLIGIGREAQVPALLDAYGIPYTFSDPLVMSLTLHKAMTKRVIRDAGIPTCAFTTVADPQEAAAVGFAPPYFIKPVAEGTGKGVSLQSIVRRRRDLPDACSRLLQTYRQPVLVERFLPGREFTVGITGSGDRAQILGTMEVLLLPAAEPSVYSYHNKENSEELVRYRLMRPQEDPLIAAVEDIALRAWRTLGCRDGGRLDIRCDAKGRPQFMEVNPLAGLHFEHSDLPIIGSLVGVTFDSLVARIVESAAERIPPSPANRPEHAHHHSPQ